MRENSDDRRLGGEVIASIIKERRQCEADSVRKMRLDISRLGRCDCLCAEFGLSYGVKSAWSYGTNKLNIRTKLSISDYLIT
jgi:hypothetical protein